jgi:hypothetical protein
MCAEEISVEAKMDVSGKVHTSGKCNEFSNKQWIRVGWRT